MWAASQSPAYCRTLQRARVARGISAVAGLLGWVTMGYLSSALFAAHGASAEVVNKLVHRKIDISTQFARVTTTYTVSGASGAYKFALSERDHEHLAFMNVTVKSKAVPFEAVGSVHDRGVVVYSAAIGDPGDEAKITVKAVYTDVLSPFPKEITQLEKQAVVYESSMFVPSPYRTSEQSTTLKLASLTIFSMTEAPGKRSEKGAEVNYGPFEEVKAFDSGKELRIHYVNHSPFAKVTSCLREIQVSHWGTIAVEEHYDLVHAGARMKGGFSRMDYMSHKHQYVPNPSFRELTAVLPKKASDIYYRDNIGNVSTSFVKHSSKGVELTLQSRFPMYGGWKNAWYHGYRVPTEEGLKHANSHYVLEMPFGSPIENVWVEDLTVKVILPEGAHNIEALPPFEGVTEARTERFTYLDMPGAGRPVIILRMKNVVREHNVTLRVTYIFNEAWMLAEPLMCAGFFFACFLIVMLVGRIDMRIRRGAQGSKVVG